MSVIVFGHKRLHKGLIGFNLETRWVPPDPGTGSRADRAMLKCMTYLNFLFIERHAVHDLKTRLLIGLGVDGVCLFEDHLVLGASGSNNNTC